MFTHWLRSNKWAAGILAIIRLYVGWAFVTAGWEKLSSSTPFNVAGFLTNSIQNPVLGPTKQAVYPLFTSFLKYFALPHAGLFNVVVPYGEFLVGIGLMLGTLTTAAAFFGLLMNFMYMFAGTVSTNPIDILLGIFIVVAGFNAGRIGGDYWVIPWLRQFAKHWFRRDDINTRAVGGGNKVA